jgi:hypothetical protein
MYEGVHFANWLAELVRSSASNKNSYSTYLYFIFEQGLIIRAYEVEQIESDNIYKSPQEEMYFAY